MMKYVLTNKRAILFSFAIGLLLSMHNNSFAISADSIGMVDMIQGEVYAISTTGEKRRLTGNAPIYEGDTIETIGEGAVVILMADGAQWDIFDNSKMEIISYQYSGWNAKQANDGAKYQVHEGSLRYTSGLLKDRGIVLLEDTAITPLGTTLRFETVSGITFAKVTNGTASYSQPDGKRKIIGENQFAIRDSKGNVTVYENAQDAKKDLVAALMVVAKTRKKNQSGAGLNQQTGTESAQAANWGWASVQTFANWMVNEVVHDVTTYTEATSSSIEGEELLEPPSLDGGSGIQVASPN